tara:strand:+ start:850 stop:1476 length:627 start_codon:yes stop_codon:yes gene_type:complete
MFKSLHYLLFAILLGTGILAWHFYPHQTVEVSGEIDSTTASHDNKVSEKAAESPQTSSAVVDESELFVTNTDLGWTEASEPPIELGSYLPDLEDQSFLNLNRQRLETLQVNDIARLWIPQEGETMNVSITKRVTTSSGNTVLNGNLDGDENYPFVMTLGKTSTFATISTRYAVYSLQGDTEVAWIASSAALKQNFPQEVKDYVIPKNP